MNVRVGFPNDRLGYVSIAVLEWKWMEGKRMNRTSRCTRLSIGCDGTLKSGRQRQREHEIARVPLRRRWLRLGCRTRSLPQRVRQLVFFLLLVLYLKMNPRFCVRVCVRYVWKWATNLQKISKRYLKKNAESWIMEGRSKATGSNPFEPVRTRDDVDENLANAFVVVGFRRISPTLRGNPQIWRHHPNRHHSILYHWAFFWRELFC